MSGPIDQDAFDLRYAVLALIEAGGLTYSAIAEELGTTKNTVCGIAFRNGLAKPRPLSPREAMEEAAMRKVRAKRLREGLLLRPSLYLTMPKA